MKKSVVIIGAGEIGSAIAHLLQKNPDAQAVLWDKDSKKVPDQKALEAIIPQADFVFLCVPSWVVRAAIGEIMAHLSKHTIVISLSKGIERDTQETIDAVLEKSLPVGQPSALLAGPMLAEELMQDMPGFAVVASVNEKTYQATESLFLNTNLYVEYASDMRSVALASVLKNIYAIALGIADGLGWGSNQKGWLTAAGLHEMGQIVTLLHGNAELLKSVAGIGDFLATGYSCYSRNFQVGNELIQKGTCGLESEGLVSMPALGTMLKGETENLPLFEALTNIILHKKDAKDAFAKIYPRR